MKILLLLAALAQAKTVTLPNAQANALKAKLDALPITGGTAIVCGAVNCTVTWDMENQRAFPVIVAQSEALEGARRAYMRVLAQKWKDGTISDAEKDALLRAVVLRFLEAD
jgi:hypothetical protein